MVDYSKCPYCHLEGYAEVDANYPDPSLLSLRCSRCGAFGPPRGSLVEASKAWIEKYQNMKSSDPDVDQHNRFIDSLKEDVEFPALRDFLDRLKE